MEARPPNPDTPDYWDQALGVLVLLLAFSKKLLLPIFWSTLVQKARSKVNKPEDTDATRPQT